jgi:hypothetical protein
LQTLVFKFSALRRLWFCRYLRFEAIEQTSIFITGISSGHHN